MAVGEYAACVHARWLGEPCERCPGGIATREPAHEPHEPAHEPARSQPAGKARAPRSQVSGQDYGSAWRSCPHGAAHGQLCQNCPDGIAQPRPKPELQPAGRDCPDCDKPLLWTPGNTSQVCGNGHWHLPLLAASQAETTTVLNERERRRRISEARLNTPDVKAARQAKFDAAKFRTTRTAERWLVLFDPEQFIPGSEEHAIAYKHQPSLFAALQAVNRAHDLPELNAAVNLLNRISKPLTDAGFASMLQAELKRLSEPEYPEPEPEPEYSELESAGTEIEQTSLSQLMNMIDSAAQTIDEIRSSFPLPADAPAHVYQIASWLGRLNTIETSIREATSHAELMRIGQEALPILQHARDAAAWLENEIAAGRSEIQALPSAQYFSSRMLRLAESRMPRLGYCDMPHLGSRAAIMVVLMLRYQYGHPEREIKLCGKHDPNKVADDMGYPYYDVRKN